ncbi:hypothetical protein CEUSTIGMA_g11670.t1 [Chlamydomonas eustigma]|uniref:PDZ domain-containing protein n=1 Tax=Chlamydomonas eustigma TaxID=1157962 RepID=A0A250XME5_9CHLO|nr:hypothetical protein CEUSTIGMA_g11670.t1 [Chlamydomonas eustigma]|eukprot:GAX84247.1 hypothetical protein CEUSTIGMA_g11670.t1 [Chlamydomonas eustigma]
MLHMKPPRLFPRNVEITRRTSTATLPLYIYRRNKTFGRCHAVILHAYSDPETSSTVKKTLTNLPEKSTLLSNNHDNQQTCWPCCLPGSLAPLLGLSALITLSAAVLLPASSLPSAWAFTILSEPTATLTQQPLSPGMTLQVPDSRTLRQLGLFEEEIENIRVFQQNTPSVVNITNYQAVQGSRFSMDVENVPSGLGSGFIWDKMGHVVTNYHVIQGASEVTVTLLDQTTWPAKVLGADPEKDVAVLQLTTMPEAQSRQLRPVQLAEEDAGDLLVGQKVYAIGNPFGLDHTLTKGIISGLGRELSTGPRVIKNVIQTDAAINPGNSGGVLLNSQGRVIGINTAIADPTGKGASSGVGFAIPISLAKGLVDQILEFGRVLRPALGINLGPPQLLKQLGIDGVLVLEVPQGSPAYKAGVQGTYRDIASGAIILGDVIIGIDDKPVKTYSDLLDVLDERRVGDTVKLKLLRGGDEQAQEVLPVQLGERVLVQAE